MAKEHGCGSVCVAPGLSATEGLDGVLPIEALISFRGFVAVACYGDDGMLRRIREALAQREGPLLTLCAESDLSIRLIFERHLCVDTTAAGGNASLLAEAS